ncbi:uncharacterized protein CELE_F43C1.5 [Caenorhabditis elegans]|uniref:Uncharacterized protein F43C1.5 n=1 Tax=Caenorhabditis elegans TaxID=6239 RepID=YR75_CAEEL|nr:Uncharacterized protein CELE_F43C1.5 [Caenorhabditis elegans]Q09394.2 RecName: Full=Uncharacterized protein F43C1.5 [Caenorhabditis elegans]CAA87059.2 Uncharacterized protein CELE_F43C1.5 [Caenorhabditis elegans]|eukprot:NP_497848.1 Uncharacterized protein CELE_F43C1.5 [Caenorhabditis elegans]
MTDYDDYEDRSGVVEEELLDFDRAMLDFQAMFPSLSNSHIEYVLRKYDGDVSATINELLYDNTPTTTTSESIPHGGDLTKLRQRRHEINEKLRENQKFLDTVTDVEIARAYEDQQLALLLEHREVNTLISEEKKKKSCSDSSSIQESRRHVKIPGKNSKNSKISVNKAKKLEPRRRSDEDRVPDGPYIGEGEVKSENFAAKIKETLRKASGSRISRLFSAP